MPRRRGRLAERRGKSLLPEPWLANAEPFNLNIHCTPQPWDYWPSEFSMPQEPRNQLPFQSINQWTPAALNQQSSDNWIPVQSALQNELRPEIWDQPLREPLIQQPPFSRQTAKRPSLLPNPLQANYILGKGVTPIHHKITAPSHSLGRVPLLPTPIREPFNSNYSESVGSATSYQHTIATPSYLRNRAPLLSTPRSQPCNSNDGNTTIGSTCRKTKNLSVRDPSAISDSSKKRKRSPIHSNRRSSIDTESQRLPDKPGSFRKIEFKENGELQVHVGSGEDAEKEDVQYLCSVDSKKTKVIDFIDLSKDSQTSERRNSITKADELSYAESCYIPSITFDEKETRYDEERKNHRRAHCNRCLRSYENLNNNQHNLYKAKCGHLLCVLCLRKLKSMKCGNCGKALSNFSKIVL